MIHVNKQIGNFKEGKLLKEEFLKVYNKYLPNAWAKFTFRYFSTNTKYADYWVRNIFKGVELSLFGIGFFATVLSFPKFIIAISTITFSILLLLLGIVMLGGFVMNNRRIKKIIKELGLTDEEYDYYVLIYVTYA